MNCIALIGKLKRFNDGVRSFFELVSDSYQNLCQTVTEDPLMILSWVKNKKRKKKNAMKAETIEQKASCDES